ncbi:NADH-quinone oxidoreductase subunit L [bacterium]|nr:NADH-quinone oxidoreductase subunit L [bacterium]MBU1917353.1 NADH-quinone oxidoreductase subunit L [bacterium]
MKQFSWLIPVLPLIGFLLNGIPTALGIPLSRRYVSFIACGAMLLSFIMSVCVFSVLSNMPAVERSFTQVLWPWIHVGLLRVDLAFLFDALSIVMALVVTGVGFLIHVYSIGYMRDDPSFGRFFTYLNLFCFMMLVLVLGNNLLLLFVGWEGVGLCSYLLIGFWFKDKANGAAGMKAFIVNRIGDFGMMLGLIILFWALYEAGRPTLVFSEMQSFAGPLSQVPLLGVSAVTIICLLLFVGATGKSAQVPLYVWLPDAMAGPTPVSALIHAATMVTAGVYLIGRLNWLFVLSDYALVVVATIGAFTAFIAATIGFAQNDIKKVLAYSTVSQLGFMMLAMGSGAFAAGIFHLTTHAFFKACLFLGSGSVIMAMHHEQDMRKMGGLRKYMPITFITFLVATVAICGIFPFAGFFSKDEILWQVFNRGSFAGWYYFLWAIGFMGALGTAFYMVRVVVMTFFGKCHAADHGHTPKESPLSVTFPLIVLGVLSAFAGFLNVPYILNSLFGGHSNGLFTDWLSTVIPQVVHHEVHAIEWVLMLLSVFAAAGMMYGSYILYTKRNDLVEKFTQKFQKIYLIVLDKYFVDEFYHSVFVVNLLRLNNAMAWFDRTVIDGLVNLIGKFTVVYSNIIGWCDDFFVDGVVNGLANGVCLLGAKMRRLQTGSIQHYAYVAFAGIVAILIIKLFI